MARAAPNPPRPLQMYVSVTGVVVHLLLYQIFPQKWKRQPAILKKIA